MLHSSIDDFNSHVDTTSAFTLIDMLIKRAEETPDQIVYTFIQNGSGESAGLTYSQLFQQASGLAALLQQRGLSGSRLLLVFKSNFYFTIAFFACLLAGCVAVPTAVPKRNNLAKRLKVLVDDAQASAAMVDSDEVRETANFGGEAFFWCDIRTLDLQETALVYAAQWKKPVLTADSLAFLQYTSGSTGDPKGVMVSHGNLIANSIALKKGFGYSEETIALNAMPLFHDMGLIMGVVQPIYTGFHTYLMSPVQLIQEPQRWLQLISELGVNITGGPNFLYELVAEQVKPEHLANVDLSCWKVAFCGAEPIRTNTVERFTSRFVPFGFQPGAFFPCYGLAESTLFVAGNPLQRLPHVDLYEDPQDASLAPRSIISCGIAAPDTTIVIVDPETKKAVADGEQGEIWINGSSVTQGYWRRPEITEHTFQARIDGDTSARSFLRTGDRGYIKQNELYVSGRIKDLIILYGHNYAPQDLELEAESSHSDIRGTGSAAFTVTKQEQERLVVVVELKRTALRRQEVWPEIIQCVRRAILHAYQLEVDDVVLIKTGTLPKTSSGKVQRRQCREAYLTHQLERVGEIPAKTETLNAPSPAATSGEKSSVDRRHRIVDSHVAVVRHIQESLAQILAIDIHQVDLNLGFFDLGMDSLMAVQFRNRLEKSLGVALPATLVLDYPDGNALIDYLIHQALNLAVRKPQASSPVTPPLEEPMAIVGMSCRFPKANNVEEYWQLLVRGGNAIGPIPEDRWDIDKYYDPNPDAPGKMYTRHGGFIEHIDEFDADFFGISPKEASHLDPQQRLLLEQTWLALEDAGLDPTQLKDYVTSVFVAIGGSDYGHRLMNHNENNIDAYLGTGNTSSAGSGRLSYFLGLQGPSLSIDTACASSLTALHLAAENLNQKASHIAIVGGVNIILSPEVTINCCKAHMLSVNGQCRAFDDGADGYVRSEGCAVVILKRLSDALAAGDTIHAVIRGTAINHNGHTSGITVPSFLEQQAVVRHALENAGLRPDDIDYVEAQGTGSPLGDPIEIRALAEVFKESHSKQSPLQIGSAKTNIGHLEIAAGMAGLIKVVLGMKHQKIPAHLHFDNPNQHIDWARLPISIPTTTQEWLKNRDKRRAGVSSFGFSGTNVHIIVEEAPEISSSASSVGTFPPSQLIVLSAKTKQALNELTNSYSAYLQQHPENWSDIAYETQNRRHHFEQRIALVAENAQHAQVALSEFISTGSSSSVFTGKKSDRTTPAIAMLFSGEGAQYAGMGQALYQYEPTFKGIIDRCGRVFRGVFPDAPALTDILYHDQTQLIHQTSYTAPALFAVEMALYCLWSSWGIHPRALLGYGAGEYVAACAARVFNIEDGMTLITQRARLMRTLPATGNETGKIVVVAATKDSVEALLTPYVTTVAITAYNGLSHTVISGLACDIDAVCATLERDRIATEPLMISHAFHSPFISPIIDEFKKIAASIHYQPPQYALISSLTGEPVAPRSKQQWVDYWCQHMLAPVQFQQGIQTLQQTCNTFLEIGPSNVLRALGRACIEADEIRPLQWFSSLNPQWNDEQTLHTSLAQLYTSGADVQWKRVSSYRPGQHISLPAYPFQRQRYWFENKVENKPGQDEAAKVHPGETQCSLYEHLLLFIHQNQPAYLGDYVAHQQRIVPGAAIVSMVLETAALRLSLSRDNVHLQNTALLHPILIPEEGQHIEIVIHRKNAHCYHFSVASLKVSHFDGSKNQAEPGVVHATGEIVDVSGQNNAGIRQPFDFATFWTEARQSISASGLYEDMHRRGIEQRTNSAFHVVRDIWVHGTTTVLARLELAEKIKGEEVNYQIHPTLLEGAFHSLLALFADKDNQSDDLFLPLGFKKLWIDQPVGQGLWALAQHVSLKNNQVSVDIQLLNDAGQLIGEMHEFKLQAVSAVNMLKNNANREVVDPIPAEISFLQQLHDAPAGQHYSLMLAHITAQFATVLGFSHHDIDTKKEFSSFGVDSLMVLELRNRLSKTLACAIPATTFLRYPDIDQVAIYLLEQMRVQEAESGNAVSSDHPVTNEISDDVNKINKINAMHQGEL